MIVLIGVVQIVHLIFSKLPQEIMIIPRFPIYFLIGLVTVRFNTLEKDPKFDFFDETTQLATCPECNYKIRFRERLFGYRSKCPKCKTRFKKYPNNKAKRLGEVM